VIDLSMKLINGQLCSGNGRPLFLGGASQGTWGTTTPYDAKWLAGLKSKITRRPIRWCGLYGGKNIDCRDDSQPGNMMADHLDQFIAEIRSDRDSGQRTVVTGDTNNGQSGTQNQATRDYGEDPNRWPYDPRFPGPWPDGRNLYTDGSWLEKYIQMWEHLAQRLVDEGLDDGCIFEPLAEPLAGRDATWAPKVVAVYVRIMDAIKAIIPNAIFLIGPRDAYNLSHVEEVIIPGRDDYMITGDLFWHVNSDEATVKAKWTGIYKHGLAVATKFLKVLMIQQYGCRTADDPDGRYRIYGYQQFLANKTHAMTWQVRQNTPQTSEFALIVRNMPDGPDIFKDADIAIAANYWAAMDALNA
jgi:hypothetical protein